MDFFSRDVRNSLDEMFDLNRDGKLDAGEQAYEFEFMEEVTNTDSDEEDDDDFDGDDF